jgi:NTP pyrophosphatase (non-canonical NTP hydrolase)
VYAFSDKQWPGVAKLNEECGELIQEIGKLMMIDGTTDHWSGDLRERLINEMGDVAAALIFVRDHCLTNKERLTLAERADEKVQKFEKWHKDKEVRRRIKQNRSKAKSRRSNA